MITRSLGKDPLTGLETIHHYDEVTKETHITHRQDVSGIIERNKKLHNTDHQKIGCKQEWMHAATIPEVVQIQWMKKYGIKDIYSEEAWPIVRRLLNSPEYTISENRDNEDMISYPELRDKTQKERVSIAATLYDRDDYANCEKVISIILDSDPHDSGALAILGAMYTVQDRYGQAEMVFRYGTALYPDLKCMWTGLGTSIRNPERAQECFDALEYVLSIDPDNTVALTNMASMYVEIGEYEKGKEIAEQSLSLKDDNKDAYAARDCIALASLGMEDFELGWRLNKESLALKFRKEIVYGDEERWEGEKGKSLVIYGEQGLGDEIFYGSCIPDAIEDCETVIIDCDSRLEGLFKRSFPKAHVYGTRRKAAPWLHSHEWDYRCAIADLPSFYRNDIKDFPGKPFLIPEPVRAEQWAETLKGTNIGIAFRGGNKYTNRALRTVPLEAFTPLTEVGQLISLEYSDFDYGDFPIKVYDWCTQSDDYDNVAALVSNLDYVVTTCTSIVHLAGGLGVPCFVLRNKHYAWRYAHNMPWYDSVEVIHCDGDWDEGIKQVMELIKQRKVA